MNLLILVDETGTPLGHTDEVSENNFWHSLIVMNQNEDDVIRIFEGIWDEFKCINKFEREKLKNKAKVLRRGFFHAAKENDNIRRYFFSKFGVLQNVEGSAIIYDQSKIQNGCFDNTEIYQRNFVSAIFPFLKPVNSIKIIIANHYLQNNPEEYVARITERINREIFAFNEVHQRLGCLPLVGYAGLDIEIKSMADYPALAFADYSGWAFKRKLVDNDDSYIKIISPTFQGQFHVLSLEESKKLSECHRQFIKEKLGEKQLEEMEKGQDLDYLSGIRWGKGRLKY